MPWSKLPIAIILTEHCNLNCRYCVGYAPIANKSFYDLSQLEKDLCRLSQLTDGDKGIDNIGFYGGEPLLYPRLPEAMRLVRRLFPESTVGIFTNGLRLSNQTEEFWLTAKEIDMYLSISDYAVDTPNRENEIRLLANYGVRHNYTPSRSLFHHNPIDMSGQQNAQHQFNACWWKDNCGLYFNEGGKLFRCCRPACIHIFNKYFGTNLEVSPQDYVNIYQCNSLDEILQWLTKPIPFCRYCKMHEAKADCPWGVSRKKIEEWT